MVTADFSRWQNNVWMVTADFYMPRLKLWMVVADIYMPYPKLGTVTADFSRWQSNVPTVIRARRTETVNFRNGIPGAVFTLLYE